MEHLTDNQTIDCTTFDWEVLIMHSNELHLFMGQGIPLIIKYYTWHSSSRNKFYVFSYDAVSGQDSIFPYAERMRYMLSYGRGLKIYPTKVGEIRIVN